VRALGRAESLDGLLTALVEELLPLLHAEHGCPGVRTADGLTCQFYVGAEGARPLQQTWLRGEGIPGWVLAQKQTYLSNEAQGDPRHDPGKGAPFKVRSVLCTPIQERGGEVIGFFAIYNKRDSAGFTQTDVEIAATAALIAGLAVQADLSLRAARGAERATRSYAESIRLLRDIAIASNTASTPQDALQAGIDRICAYCGWPVGHALLCGPDDPDRLFSSPVWHFDAGEPYARLRSGVREGQPPGAGSLAVRVLKTRQALWLPITPGEADVEGSLDFEGLLKAAYALPVWSGPDVVAVLEFYSAEDEQANLARLDMLTQICSLLGHVIVRSRTLGQLEAARDRLRQLSAGLMESHELERRRIALELHDEIGQSLTVIKLHLEAIKTTPPDSERHQDQIEQCLGVADAAIQQVRVLTLELRPSKLDDLGLSAAIRWLLDQQARLGGLSPVFHEEYLPERLPPNVETACYRIAQEALNNVIRHARAKRVWVYVALHESMLHLSVRDDGAGFDAQEIRQKRTRTGSLGLIGMEERASLAGGELRITSRPGHGTKVHATIPIVLDAPVRES
jgi:signal transduction histidine kinase